MPVKGILGEATILNHYEWVCLRPIILTAPYFRFFQPAPAGLFLMLKNPAYSLILKILIRIGILRNAG